MLYIVLVWVQREHADAWGEYMARTHVPDMMDTGCFVTSHMARDEESDTDDEVAWRVYYVTRDRADLDRYLAEHAEAMRADHVESFGGVVRAKRELLPTVTTGR